MNISDRDRSPGGRWVRRQLAGCAIGMMLTILASSQTAVAQNEVAHRHYSASMPPGAIGRQQLQSNARLRGYVQPVRITAPDGTVIAPAISNSFDRPLVAPANLGLLAGGAYRFKVTDIPRMPGVELYPSIELIDRTYPPEGKAAEYPIVVELAWEDLRLAAKGNLVTRVIYLEDTNSAVAKVAGSSQEYFEVAHDQDPLHVANQLGRSVAILRFGSRTPLANQPVDSEFLFHSPPVQFLTQEFLTQGIANKPSRSVAPIVDATQYRDSNAAGRTAQPVGRTASPTSSPSPALLRKRR